MIKLKIRGMRSLSPKIEIKTLMINVKIGDDEEDEKVY